MKRLVLLVLASLSLLAPAQTLKTRWAAGVTPENAWREYPRPQMVRKQWVNLNGPWDCTILPPLESSIRKPEPRKILVPFPVESQLSGFHGRVGPKDTIQYERSFSVPKGVNLLPGQQTTERVLLHFGAVDWKTTVYVNDKQVGTHTGGYDPFTIDITEAVTTSGPQKLRVMVTDPSDAGFQPRGKQVLRPGGIFYTSVSGIWQTVWLEAVPQTFIGDIKIQTSPKAGQVTVDALILGNPLMASIAAPSKAKCRVEVLANGKVLGRSEQDLLRGDNLLENPGYDIKSNPISSTITIPDHEEWSPEHPYLYDVRITLLDGGKVVDQVTSYFGFRELALMKDGTGQPRISLNGKPIFLVGPLDQGFWPDGIYTPPSDAAMKYDLEVTKRLGFNMIRKHVKVEPERWYYWCDKMGICVLQDMPSGDKFIGPSDPDITRSPESGTDFEAELKALVDTHYNHPSIVTWVLYNEGWGQWDTARMTKWLKEYDPSRLVDSVTGWADRPGIGDYSDVHVYPGPGAPNNESGRAIFLGEFGGLGLPVPGHMWQEKGWGYQSFKTSKELTDKFVEIFTDLRFLQAKGLSGAVYTQTTDVETELNGLMTYDRAILKMDEQRVRRAVTDLFLPPPTMEQVIPTSEESGVMWRYLQTSVIPSGKWVERQLDDSSWMQGPGGFGTPETPGSVVRTRWDTKDIYLRRRFALPRSFAAGELMLRLSYDDDVEVFLDDKLIYKSPGWTTSYRMIPLSVALSAGEHLLAIHCHQNSGGQYVDAGLVRVK